MLPALTEQQEVNLPYNSVNCNQVRRIFISYCLKNSKQSDGLNPVGTADPQVITREIEKRMNEKCWIDTDVNIGGQNFYSALKMGIEQAEVMLLFISDQYAQSNGNELIYAYKICKKPIIPIVVGEGMEWRHSPYGFLLNRFVYIDFRNSANFNLNMDNLIDRIGKILSIKK